MLFRRVRQACISRGKVLSATGRLNYIDDREIVNIDAIRQPAEVYFCASTRYACKSRRNIPPLAFIFYAFENYLIFVLSVTG